MAAMSLFFLLLCAPTLSFADEYIDYRGVPPSPFSRRSNVPPEGYFNPLDTGGGMLTSVPGTFPAGLGEPLNAIITSNSDPDVMKDQETDGGLRNYFLSFGYSGECLGQHLGDDQAANLGDGHGLLNETAVIRWNYGDPELGSCKETIEGAATSDTGFRMDQMRTVVQYSWQCQPNCQWHYNMILYLMGTTSDGKFPFLLHFMGGLITPLHSDYMIGNATNQSSLIPPFSVTNTSTFSGQTTFANYTYQTDVIYVSGLLSNTSVGVNHNLSVPVNGSNAIDGLVAVMNVRIVGRPSQSSHAFLTFSVPSSWTFSSLVALVAILPTLSALLPLPL